MAVILFIVLVLVIYMMFILKSKDEKKRYDVFREVQYEGL